MLRFFYHGEVAVITGGGGQFQIKNLPSGTSIREIKCGGYFAANYSNYDVDSEDGTTIFTFYINKYFLFLRRIEKK